MTTGFYGLYDLISTDEACGNYKQPLKQTETCDVQQNQTTC